MSIDIDELKLMIHDCEQRESRLTEWERTFIDSINDQLGRGRSLTPKQADTLEAIWDRATAKG